MMCDPETITKLHVDVKKVTAWYYKKFTKRINFILFIIIGKKNDWCRKEFAFVWTRVYRVY